MAINPPREIKLTEAINWIELNRPELFLSLTNRFKDIIESDDMLGEAEDNEKSDENSKIKLLKRKAELMLIVVEGIESDIEQSLIIASRLTLRAKNWNLIGWFATIFFSASTVAILNTGSIKEAQWLAAGTTISSLSGFISGYLTKISDGETKLSAGDARDRLIRLRYDLKDGRSELQLKMEFPEDKDKFEKTIIFLNNLCREVNMIHGLITSLKA